MPENPATSIDPDEWFETRRRQLIASAGTAGPVGVAGCLGGGNDAGTVADRHTTDRSGGGADRKESGRIGDAVFYRPDDDGPYPDGQAALDDVPPGGTFIIGQGTWDVAEEGRLVADRSISIFGSGVWKKGDTFGDDSELRGTVIRNTGDDPVDKPAVAFSGPGFTDADRPERMNGRLRNLGVMHEGPSSPAVWIDEAIRTHIADCWVTCRNAAPTGIKYGAQAGTPDESRAFFSRAARNTVQSATDIGVHVTGPGYAHEFYSNHIATGVDGATAFQTQRQRTILVGGECAATGENGVAVKFYNPGTGGQQYGGFVIEPGIEHTERPIVIDGKSPFNDVQLYHIKMSLRGDVPAVTFGASDNSKLFYPVVKRHHSGPLVRWSDRSLNCGVLTDGRTIANGAEFVNDGAMNPYVSVTGSVTNNMVEQLPTGVPMAVEYHEETGGPAFYDGEVWRRPRMQIFSPDS
jgi:hypothetical protein